MIFSPVKWLPCVLLFFSLVASAQEIPSGDSRGASITPGSVQTWAFATQAGKTTYLQVAAVSGAPFAPTIRVYDPQGVQVVSDTGGQTAATYFTASKTGTFTVQVADTATPDGPTVYRIFHTSVSGPQVVPAGDEGGELSNGVLRAGTISPGDIDTWTYQANADEEVVIHVTKPTPSSLRPEIFVYGPNGDRYGGESSALDVVSVRCTPNIGGRFTVMVKDGNSHAPGFGDYQIEASRPLAPFTVAAGDEGGALANGANHDGVITKGDMDLWTFSANAGEEIFFTLGKTDASSLAPSILLYSPQGTLLSPYNSYSGEYRITIPTGGPHAVLVRDGNLTGSGGYRLGFLRTGADFIVPAGDEGGLLVNGGKYTGTLSPGETDAWHFQAEAGEQLLIRVSEMADTALIPNLELFGPGGRRVAFYAGGPNSTSLDHLTTEAGEYVLTLGDRSSTGLQTASYNLYFSQSRGPVIIPPGDEGGPLVSDVNRAGSIPRGDIDTWTFDGLAGQHVIFSLVEPVASSLEPWMRLFGPDGEEVGDNGTTSLQAKLPKAGRYSLVVADYDQNAAGSGDYRLSFHLGGSPLVIPEGDEGGTLQIGKRNQGTTAMGDRDCWTIQATAAERLRLVAIRADNSNFNAHISIWGPSGELITSYFGIFNTASATLNWTPPASGLYTVSIIDGNQAAGESCSYYLQCARALPEGEVVIEGGDEGGVLTPGDHDGSIPIGDLDPWVFDAVAGDQVTLALVKRGGMSLYCNLQVYGPDGSLFLSAISDSNTTLPVNLTGRYTAWVSDLQYGGGDYRFSYARTPGSSAIPAGTPRGSLNSGGNYSRSLAAGGVDLWTFTAEAGERVILRGTNTGIIATPRLRVTGPDGIRVAEVSRTDSAMTEFTCASAGTFTVAVDDREGVVSSYLLCMAKTAGSFEIPSGDQGGVIGSGEEVSASLARGDMDFWSFTASAGERVRVHLTETVPSGTTATLTPDLRIYRPDGSLMAAVSKSDFADPDSTAAVEFICDAAGSYLIRAAKTDARAGTCTVRMVKSTGAYAFAPQDRGGLISSGSEEIAPLAPGDVDLWHVQAVAGQRFSFHMNSMGGLMNPNVRVFAPDGRMIAERWNYTNAIVDFGCDVAGTYLVEVRDHAERYSGNYRLCLYDLTGTFSTPAGDQGGEITNSSPGQGSVHAGDVDLWSFEASEGEPVRVHISDPVDIRIFSPSGKLVGQRQNQTSKSIGFRAVESGTYTVVLYTYSSSANPITYVCKLAKGFGDAVAPAGDEGGLIASGAEVSGSVSEPDVDLWFIDAEAGDHLDVRLVSPSGTFYPRIYRPDGSLMYGPVTIESNVALYLSCDMAGRYAIEVRPGYYGGGSYSLRASNTRGSYSAPLAGDQGGTLPSDNRMVGSLSPQDVDLWSFTSRGGEGVTFTPAGTGSSPTFDIDVYRPDGSRIASSRYFNSVPFSFEADVPGAYRFSIRSRWGNTPSDSYSITVGFKAGGLFPVPGGAGGTLASGVLQAASLANGASTFWTFQANAGDVLSFLLSVSGGGDGFAPQLRIYGPQGILIGSGSAVNLTVLTAGSYHVEVVDIDSRGDSGQYQILATGTPGPVPGITLISPEPGILILSWPSSFPGALQQSDTLKAGSWQIVPGAPHDDGQVKYIEIDTGDAPRRYYRLAEP